MSTNAIFSLPKSKLIEFIARFNDYDVYAPCKDGDRYLLQKITAPENIDLGYSNTSNPAKSVIFPQAECMMDYSILENGFKVEDRSDKPSNSIIFGMRNCDARAFIYLDKVMLEGKYNDPYYARRRNETVLVGLACNTPPYYNCFCTSLGGSPHSTDNLDIQMVDLDDTYLIEPLTEKGKDILTKAEDLLSDPKPGDSEKRVNLAESSAKAIVGHLDVDGIPEKLDGMFENNYWTQVSNPCIGCGICTFLCPTCFCFDINDIGGKKSGQRVRVWDTCQFPEYTMHASSHNPRDNKMKRQRQRFYHKYCYSMENQHMIGCVGCGRCINQCPTQIDIVDVISGTMEVDA